MPTARQMNLMWQLVATFCYPDHVHFSVRGGPEFVLKNWMAGLKRAMTVAAKTNPEGAALWQPGFFDHILRNDESYSVKWNYVRENPVRHGLVDTWDEWPYQGEIVRIDRA
jgi:putative transposase